MFFRVNFRDTDLDQSIFREAVLYSTFFGRGVSLRRANFARATFWNCRFAAADITGCNFENAEGIKPRDFTYSTVFGTAFWIAPKEHRLADDIWEDRYAPKFPREWEETMGKEGFRVFVEQMRRPESSPSDDWKREHRLLRRAMERARGARGRRAGP